MIDFRNLIPKYADGEIITILKKRKYYQPEAAELAIQEAIKRGIIHSEQDLFAPEFQEKKLQKQLFPAIEKMSSRIKIIKSIARGFVILGVLPIIYGFVLVNKGNQIEGGIVAFGGLVWIFCSALLLHRLSKKWLNFIVIFTLISFLYSGKFFITANSTNFTDIFIVAIVYGFLAYGIVFIRRLLK